MRYTPLPSVQLLREMLDYDPDTGIFTWKVNRGGGARRGKIAGTLVHGYIRIILEKRQYSAHRLAWVWMTGGEPPCLIDHRDVDGTNNRWGNLRIATHSQNKTNGRIYRTNKSGAKGVHQAPDGKWVARINVNGRRIHLGCCSSKKEAILLRQAKASEFHGEFARAA